MNHTSIEWTDATWNPVRGCSRVSEGCRNCYAARVAARFSGPGLPYEGLATITPSGPRWTGRVRLVAEHLEDPLRWKKPRRIFVNSMSDLFHESLEDEEIERVFGVMALAQQHTFQVLTKRPDRMLKWFTTLGGMESRELCVMRSAEYRSPGVVWDGRGSDPTKYSGFPGRHDAKWLAKRRAWPGWPLPNVWLGVSVEDQATADERIPVLLDTPAAVRLISAEPLIGAVEFRPCRRCNHPGDVLEWPCSYCMGRRFEIPDWVIVGGESGPGARPCDVRWIRDIVRQCRRNDVPAFVKQVGAAYADAENDLAGRGYSVHPDASGPTRFLKSRKGGDPAEWPADLRVREFPEVAR